MSQISKASSKHEPEPDTTALSGRMTRLMACLENLKGMTDCGTSPVSDQEMSAFINGTADYLKHLVSLSKLLDPEKFGGIQQSIKGINDNFRASTPAVPPGVAPSHKEVAGKSSRRDRKLTQKTLVDHAEALYELIAQSFNSKSEASSMSAVGSLDDSSAVSLRDSASTLGSDCRKMLEQFPTLDLLERSKSPQTESSGDSSASKISTIGPNASIATANTAESSHNSS